MDVFAHIVLMELKIGVSKQVLDVFEVTRDEVIHTNDPKAILYEALT
jgi:hypothetical protein